PARTWPRPPRPGSARPQPRRTPPASPGSRPPHSTAGHARHSAGRHQPKHSTNSYSVFKAPVLRPPVESGLYALFPYVVFSVVRIPAFYLFDFPYWAPWYTFGNGATGEPVG